MPAKEKRDLINYDFVEFLADRNVRSAPPLVNGDGDEQRDPDKPDQSQELISAMKEIIDLAKRAIERRTKGLADKSGNQEDDHPTKDQNDIVTRPKADNPASLFGEE